VAGGGGLEERPGGIYQGEGEEGETSKVQMVHSC